MNFHARGDMSNNQPAIYLFTGNPCLEVVNL